MPEVSLWHRPTYQLKTRIRVQNPCHRLADSQPVWEPIYSELTLLFTRGLFPWPKQLKIIDPNWWGGGSLSLLEPHPRLSLRSGPSASALRTFPSGLSPADATLPREWPAHKCFNVDSLLWLYIVSSSAASNNNNNNNPICKAPDSRRKRQEKEDVLAGLIENWFKDEKRSGSTDDGQRLSREQRVRRTTHCSR